MSVLLLRLAGPMQSWGTRSRFGNRDTGPEPSRSGVIGLLCAALGRPRDQSLDDFRPLAMGVRVLSEGRVMRDYQTAMDVRRADPSKGTQDTVLSERFYLADADFLVGLEGEPGFLARLDAAVRRPVWPLSLGRKAFVPSLPVAAGIADGTVPDALRAFIPTEIVGRRGAGANDRYVLEVGYGDGEPRADVPVSFADRRFLVRHVRTRFFPITTESPDVPQQVEPEHP